MTMKESDIMQMIISDQSWEQIISEIITAEALDPWDLDIGRLSDRFAKHIEKLDTMDFVVPAKYVIIAAVLLGMKSEDLQLLDFGREPDMEPDGTEILGSGIERVNVSPLALPPRRSVHRKIVVEELIAALRRVLATQERREVRARIRPSIEISDFDIEERINSLYTRISALMGQMSGGELKFSQVVPKWEREHIIDTFLPLMYLDNQRKLHCRQEEYFKDIFIGKGEKNLDEKVVIANEIKKQAKTEAKARRRKKA
ncbi:MAG: hypothetical protein FJY76_01705 [Candidatus Aenigmarchaeota archaeon]|nr:hypothetical protein [Candidatus Aenigmarchaeota archaeon]